MPQARLSRAQGDSLPRMQEKERTEGFKELRQKIAGMAMCELINSDLIRDWSAGNFNARIENEDRVRLTADLSVLFADALLERLQHPKPGAAAEPK